MSKVSVYDYLVRHVGAEEMVRGPYMATRETIEKMGGTIIDTSEQQVEDALVIEGKVMRDTVVHYGTGLG